MSAFSVRGLITAVAFTFATSHTLASSVQCEQEQLTVSMVPKKSVDEQAREYQPLVELLEQSLDIPVELIRATSYQSVMDGILSGGIDLAVMGPASYILARQQDPAIEAFASLTMAAGAFTPEGSFYYSLLIVPGSGDATRIDDLRGKRILLTDPSSTSGALVPKQAFSTHIAEPFSSFFGSEIYAGSHDKALIELLANKAEAAFVSSARVDEMIRRGLVNPSSMRVLWQSDPLHYDPFVFRSGVCDDLRNRIIELISRPSPELKAFLRSQQAVGINPVSHDDYAALEAVVTD